MKTKMLLFVIAIMAICSVSAHNPIQKKTWKWERRNGKYVKALINKPESINILCYAKPYKEIFLVPSDTIGYRPAKNNPESQQYDNYLFAEGGITIPTNFTASVGAGMTNDFDAAFTAIDFKSSLSGTKASADLFLAIGAKKFQYLCMYGKVSTSPSDNLKLERFGFGTSIHFSQVISPKIITRGYVYLIGGESFYRKGYYNMDERGHVFGASFVSIMCHLAKDFRWGTVEGSCSGGLDLPKGHKTLIYYDVNTRILKNILKVSGRWHGQIGVGFDLNEADKKHLVLVMRITG